MKYAEKVRRMHEENSGIIKTIDTQTSINI